MVRDNSGVICLFYIWAFVLLGRPQDIFTSLAPLRPALILSIITFVFFLTKNTTMGFQKAFRNPQFTLFITFICIMVMGIPFAYHRRVAFMFIFLTYLSNILFFLVYFYWIDSIGKLKNLLFIGCVGTALYSVYSLTNGIVIKERLVFGEMFDPNDLAFFILSFLPLNFLFISKDNLWYKKTIGIANLVFGTLVVLMTGSRGGFIGLAITLLLILFANNQSIRRSYKGLFVVVGIIVILAKGSDIDFDRYWTIGDLQDDYNVSDEWGRVEVWKVGMGLMLSHPLTGVGVNCFDMAIGEERGKRGEIPKWQTAHNSLVQAGAETGIFGFIVFGMINLRAFRIFWRSKNNMQSVDLAKIAELGGIGFLGHFICAMFLSQAYSIYWVFYAAFSAKLFELTKGEEETGKAILLLGANRDAKRSI